MIFVVADQERSRLGEMTTLLLSIFPGSTVYQHANLARASGDVLRHRVDALFAVGEQKDSAELMEMLQKKKPELPVLFLSDMEGIGYGHLPQTVVGQKLRSILLTVKAEGG